MFQRISGPDSDSKLAPNIIDKYTGVNLDDIALFAGHKSTETTRLYLHLAPTELSQRIRTKVDPFDAPIRSLVESTLEKERFDE
jgi:hypothetical protein